MTEVQLRWHTSAALRLLGVMALMGLISGLLLAKAGAMIFAAAALGALLAAGRFGRPPERLRVTAALSEDRCFEDDVLVVRVDAQLPAGVQMDVRPILPFGMAAEDGGDETEHRIRVRRWGGYELSCELVFTADAGLLLASVELDFGAVRVFPRPTELRRMPVPADLPDRVGLHVSTGLGEGSEFAGIRTYATGDRLRQVNWKASARHGQMLVNERLPEKANDVVAMIDAYGDVGPVGSSSLDLAVHAASDLAQAALRDGDRAGVVVLGGLISWLPAELGARQFYRIVEHVLDARTQEFDLEPNLERIPRTALPERAVVIVLTPLVDPRTIGVLRDLRARGRTVVVVDVLRGEPAMRVDRRQAELALRMWRIERRGIRMLLADLGIPLVPWEPGLRLDAVLAPVSRRRLVRRSGAFSGVSG
ncbi:DUF58 domain-containing protein [Fodinicola acaciae]|uniref:DUF58 domain-containing protein n=1 Tax=Fodinicola acaciae TaxID=2681555 RepID=UPI0013D3F83B|nr:DUF58 domain-containing protein [Fodinicola acaciae]